MTPAAERWCVVGGGMLGLTIAHRLAQRGREVTVIEAAPEIGGLAGAWQLGDVVWDRHYHVTLLSDRHLRALLGELGLEQEMDWVETRTGCCTDGVVHSVSNTVEFLRFPGLGLVDKLRLGGTILYGSRIRNGRRLEHITVEAWLRRWSGDRTFERFWLPLLRAKLGDGYVDSSAAFIWATIQRLYSARRSGLKKEMFGYVPGGYARILDRLANLLAGEGVELVLASPVRSVRRGAGGVEVVDATGRSRTFEHAVVTANASLGARMIDGLTDAERTALSSVRYQGIVCASVLLDRPLSPFYLINITDDAPFTGVVEMSALVDRRHFGGRCLVYLPKYCAPDDPLFTASDAEIEERFLTALGRIHPHFDRRDVRAFRVSRVREVFAIPTLHYSEHLPAVHCSVPGVHLVTSAQIVNAPLNVNDTVALAERSVATLVADGDRGTAVTSVPARTKGSAALSLDLDDLWSYLKTHGDPGWRSFPSFLDVVVPRALRFLDERDLAVTWFIVGKDAARACNHDLLGAVVDAGHEIANHSFLHEPWLHRYSSQQIDDDIARAEEAIERATGVRTEGFRAPGFSLSADVLRTLVRRGYRYDASTLPTFIGPVARRWYFRGAELSMEQQEERDALYGPWQEGTRPNRPYRFTVDGEELLEIPTTTFPGVRTPMHMSYLLFLAERSPQLADAYLAAALRACRASRVAPSILIHSHDFVGCDDAEELRFFPGFASPGAVKLERVAGYLERIRQSFDLAPLGRHATRVDGAELQSHSPRFFHGAATAAEHRGAASPSGSVVPGDIRLERRQAS